MNGPSYPSDSLLSKQLPSMFVKILLLSQTLGLVCCSLLPTKPGFKLEQGIPHLDTDPYFLQPPAHNISTLEGQSAYLHCRVAQLGDKKVSWIRRRDLHVLTSGLQTFSSDQRFIPLHGHRSENWTLHIRFSQTRDSGEYQCQVNTNPRMSMIYFLHVQDANTVIEGSSRRYVRTGSTIQLTCRTPLPWQSPGLLYWYQDAEILHSKGRVSIDTHIGNETVSNLTIEGATLSDSGNYTCWPTKFLPSSVMVHVVAEAKAAAKSQGVGSNAGSPPPSDEDQASSSNPVIASTMMLIMVTLHHMSSVIQLPNG